MKILKVGLLLAVLGVLAACGGKTPIDMGSGGGGGAGGSTPQPPGDGTLVVQVSSGTGVAPQGMSLQAAPEPTHARVRVYRQTSGGTVTFNLLKDVEIPESGPAEVAFTVPAGDGYKVDAVRYARTSNDNTEPLTDAGRRGDISIQSEAVTQTTVPVGGYTVTWSAPEEVTEGEQFTIEVTVEGPNIWGGGYHLAFSGEPWATDNLWPVETLMNGLVVSSNETSVTVRFTRFAPGVNEPTTYYYGLLFVAGSRYYDLGAGLPAPVLYSPSVDRGEILRTITVNPLP